MRIQLQRIANPYTMFAIAWTLGLVLYSFNWAGIFPVLKTDLLFFLVLVISLFGLTGFAYNKLSLAPKNNNPVKNRATIFMIFNLVFFLPNFVYSGIPLLTGLRDENFGIPTVKVFAIGFNCFLAVYCFYNYLITRKKNLILYIVICIVLFFLILSRGLILLMMVSMFFVWINYKKPVLTLKKLLIFIFSGLLISYLFGVAGNIRTINDIASYTKNYDTRYSSDAILSIGQATPDFRKNFVPSEYFWAYIYLASPLSNLQYNVNHPEPGLTFENLNDLFVNEVLFDFISKRVDEIYGSKHKQPALVVAQLTVSTTLAESYVYAGWLGMAFFVFVLWLIPLIYLYLVRNNPLGILGMATLSTIFFFSIFDNMFIISGLSMQLLFPLLIGVKWKGIKK